MNKNQIYKELSEEVEKIVAAATDRDTALLEVCKVLEAGIDYFDWVGFYIVDPESDRELVLGPYVGEETDHSRIAFGTGICGQAAEREETFVIQDVSKEDNYLACSLSVKSEIVVPVFKDGAVIAELDVDSEVLEPFTEEDKIWTEKISGQVSKLF